MYRWHITDPVYFSKNIRITVQAIGWGIPYNELKDDVSSTVFFYLDALLENNPEYPAVEDRLLR